jgi:site-specific recombinase XerD
MELYFTGDEFVVNGMPFPDIPFLVDRGMDLVHVANKYLFYISVIKGRTSSPETWKTYAKHLHEYFSFLEENSLTWKSVDENEIAAWRNSMVNRELERSTINQRLNCIFRFYRWSHNEKFIQALPLRQEEIITQRPKGFLAHIDSTGNRVWASQHTLQELTKLPKWLMMDQALAFVDTLSPHRNRLMGYLMLACGLRRAETVGLDLRVFSNPCGHPENESIRMTLAPLVTPTKGQKERWVTVPYPLAEALWKYYLWERPRLARMFKKKYGKETTRLFLSEKGELLSQDGFTELFKEHSKRTGIKCTPHMLRHTFGTYEYLRVAEKKDQDSALIWVRDRMGHASTKTTEKYVHAAALVSSSEIDGYQAELCAKLRKTHGD